MYSKTFDYALDSTASLLGMNREWLYNVIMMESTWNPAAYNSSGAIGLIQFMPKTLKDFGMLSPALAARVPDDDRKVPEDVKASVKKEFLAKFPDVVSQLFGPVTTYFKRYRTYPTEQSVYMTVFYPKNREASLDTVFNARVQAQNPGIKTVGDYVAKVQSRSRTNDIIAKAKSPLSVATLAALAVAGYFSMRS